MYLGHGSQAASGASVDATRAQCDGATRWLLQLLKLKGVKQDPQ